jgi:hypothetical protein
MSDNTRRSELGSADPANTRSSARVAQTGVFYKEGDYCCVGRSGTTVRLKDSKGLVYLSYLLRHPATEFHVLDLIGGIAGGSDADEVDRSAPDSMGGDFSSSKEPESVSADWEMPAQCWMIKPRALTDAASVSYVTNWKKPKRWEKSTALSS